ncbi:MAG: hypothetical protein ABIF18_00085, partial [archaeon]
IAVVHISSTLAYLYSNGKEDVYGGDYNPGAIDGTVNNPLVIGSQQTNTDFNYYTGLIDEVRISNVARSAGWIATEYNNQFSPDSFYSVGEEIVESSTKTGLVNDTIGATPFYTNQSNPRNISLSQGESQLVTFWVNATGEVDTTHLFFAFANMTSNMSVSNITSEWNVTIVSRADTTPPTFTTVPANTTINYTQGFGVDFDADDETEFDSYAINWTDTFEINSTGYLKNSTSNIAVGIYLINVTINDTSNNLNSTIYKVTINKATPTGSLTNDQTWTEDYGTEIVIGLSESQIGDGDVTYIVYRDGVSKGTGETVNLSAGTYDYVLNTTGGANWTANASMDSETLTINKIVSQTSLTFSLDSPQTYGATITPTCSVVSGEGSAVLKQDDVIITSGVAITLGADSYSFNCSYAETQNYTSSENVSDYTISKASLSASITNDTLLTKTYDGTLTTIGISESNSGDGDVTYKLYVDGIDEGNSYVQNTAGTYSVVLNSTGGTNYSTSASLDSETLTINQASTSCQVLFNETSPITYPETFLVYSDCDSDFTLKRNGSVISNNSEQILGAETYNFSVQRTDTTNYSTIYDDEDFTIDKATPEGSLNSNLGWTINETQEVVINLSESNTGDGDVTYIIYRDGVSKTTGEIWSPTFGTYEYVLNTTGGTNWTSNVSMDSQTLTVNDITNPNINLTFPLNTTYTSIQTQLNFSRSDTNLAGCWYSLDEGATNSSYDSSCLNISGLDSGQGSSTWTIYINDSAGNENSSSVTFFVDSINPSVTLLTESPSDPVTYSSGATYEFNATITDTNLQIILIEFDGINYTATQIGDVYSFSISDLSVGVYNYRWFANDTFGNSNNTGIGSYTIDKATPTGLLSGTASINYLIAGDVTGSETNTGDGGCSYKLYREGVEVSNPDIDVLGVGVWNYIYNSTECDNYSASASLDTFVLTVNKISSSVNLTLGGVQGNYSIDEDTSIDLNCSIISGDTGVYLVLYNNGTLINNGTSPIGNTTLFSEIGNYNITCVYERAQNYTASSETWWLEVNDTTAPTFDNLQNHTNAINTSFTFDLNATDISGIGNFILNDTSYFDINESTGVITNVTSLYEEKIHWLNVSVNDSVGNMNSEIFYINVTGDVTSPVVYLISPANAYSSTSTSTSFSFNVTDNSATNCSLIVDWQVVNSNSSVNISGGTNSFTNTIAIGTHTWLISCTDSANNSGNSSARNLTITSVVIDDDGSSSDGGGGGGGGGTSVVVEEEFTLDKTQIDVKLEQGETKEVFFSISNPTKVIKNFEVTSDLEDMMRIDNGFSLEPEETRNVKLDIIAKETKMPNIYLGRIHITDGKVKKEILISIEVVSKESLFDVELEISKDDIRVLSGEEITFEVALTRLLQGGGTRDVTINYVIKDEEGNEISSSSDTRAIETTMSFIKTIDFSKNLAKGKYFLYVQVEYEGKIASASSWFEVESEKSLIENYFVLIVVVVFIGLVGVIIYLEKRKTKKKSKKIARKNKKKK